MEILCQECRLRTYSNGAIQHGPYQVFLQILLGSAGVDDFQVWLETIRI
jgi:hypothetical protein